MATAAKSSATKPGAVPPASKDVGKSAAAPSTGSNSSKSATGSATGSAKDAASSKKPSLKPGDSAPAVLLWPDGKPILGSDGKPIDPATLTIVMEKDGKYVVHGPDGKPFLLPDGKPLDPALVPPKGAPAPGPPPKPYLGVPPPRFMRPPWEKPTWRVSNPPRFVPYHPQLMKALKMEVPPQVEFQDGAWDRTMINLRKNYTKLVKLHLGPVGVNFEKHPGPCQCFIQILVRDIPDYPELVGKPQFSTCNYFVR